MNIDLFTIIEKHKFCLRFNFIQDTLNCLIIHV